MYICIYIYIYVYIYMYIYMYIYIYIYIYIYVYICIYVYMYICIYIYIYTFRHTHTRVYIYIQLHMKEMRVYIMYGLIPASYPLNSAKAGSYHLCPPLVDGVARSSVADASMSELETCPICCLAWWDRKRRWVLPSIGWIIHWPEVVFHVTTPLTLW